jgi:beta-glucosidase/6-phospho-beta-glucosidase/beta-galactosidase
VVPWGIRKVLNYIAQRYNNPPIYVTENGIHSDSCNSNKHGLILSMVFDIICIDAHVVANWVS